MCGGVLVAIAVAAVVLVALNSALFRKMLLGTLGKSGVSVRRARRCAGRVLVWGRDGC